MNGAFLAFKYKALNLGFQYSASGLKNVGWNIRKKYRRHVEDDQVKANLSQFADRAIDDQVVDYETLSDVNEALLQAQKWRFDKEKFTIDPPHEEAWDKMEGMISVSEEHPAIIMKFLKDKGYVVESISHDLLQPIFLKLLLVELLKSVAGNQITGLDHLDCAQSDQAFLSDIVEFSSECGELSELTNASDIFEIIEMFGFSKVTQISNFPDPSEIPPTQDFKITFSEEALPPNKLFTLSHFEAGMNVKLNSNNKCVQRASKNVEIKSFIEVFLKAYINSMENMQAHSSVLNDFTSYLALSLDREFSKKSAEA